MRKLSTVSVFVSTVALAALCGCASNSSQSQPTQTAAQTPPPAQTAPPANQPPPKPKKDKRPIEERLVIGMAMDDVKTACGNPRNVNMNSDGSAVWVYASGSPAFNPFGGWGAKFHYVTIYFDTNGKVKSWSTADSNNGPPF